MGRKRYTPYSIHSIVFLRVLLLVWTLSLIEYKQIRL